jgi:hypothetical protein
MSNDDEQSLDDELFWRAFCYVNGEQTPDEVHRFEAQLAFDQQAREAVAAVVRLSAAVAVPLSELSTPRTNLTPAFHAGPPVPHVSAARHLRRLWSSRTGWATLALAACLAIMLSLPHSEKPPRGDAQPAPFVAAELARYNLASAWADALAEPGAADDRDLDASITPGSLEGEDELVTADDDAELIVSQWLLEAVTARAEGTEGADGARTNTSHRDT